MQITVIEFLKLSDTSGCAFLKIVDNNLKRSFLRPRLFMSEDSAMETQMLVSKPQLAAPNLLLHRQQPSPVTFATHHTRPS
jgi:hypothetical protein